MGLDMYLEVGAGPEVDKIIDWRRSSEEGDGARFVWRNDRDESSASEYDEAVRTHGLGSVADQHTPFAYINDTSAMITVMYWRKANAIHKWFVDEVQDGVDECQISELTTDHLADLLSRCQGVKNGGNPSDLLPTASGFFFGSTDYDEWYNSMLDDTVRKCMVLVASLDKNPDWRLFYHSSW